MAEKRNTKEELWGADMGELNTDICENVNPNYCDEECEMICF